VNSNRDRIRLLTEVAQAYYEQGRTQEEIARELGVSRSQVSHYLTEAREIGIVQIRVVSPEERATEVEERLHQRFPHLKEVRVASLFGGGLEVIRRVIGRAAAEVLHEAVLPGHRVCIGCGRTLREMVRALRPRPVENVILVQAMGSIGHEALDIDFGELAREAGKALGARVYTIPAPAVLGAGSAKELIASNPPIAEALKLARSADLYIVGLGSMETDLLYARAGLVPPNEMQILQRLPIVGDICGRFFDLSGQVHISPFEERIVGIELSDLKRASLSLGVAGGPDKVAPLLGALRGGYINGLVTDEQTAWALLRLDEGSAEGR